jgi:MtN3 and saliva related transmembrane protein
MMGLGSTFFAIQGLILENWPLFITNVITTTASGIVFGIKMYNDYWKKDK